MTSYTTRRGYPYPSSEREAGNGGLHSELLARAVAKDLDATDAAWAAQLQRANMLLSKASDQTPYSANGVASVWMDTVEKVTTGASFLTNNGLGIVVGAGGAGWYRVVGMLHSRANGTITAAAQHRAQLGHITPLMGGTVVARYWYSESFQSGSLDLYTNVEAVMHLGVGDEVRMYFFHTNTGSDARVVAAGTRLAASLIVKDE